TDRAGNKPAAGPGEALRATAARTEHRALPCASGTPIWLVCVFVDLCIRVLGPRPATRPLPTTQHTQIHRRPIPEPSWLVSSLCFLYRSPSTENGSPLPTLLAFPWQSRGDAHQKLSSASCSPS